MDNEIFLKLSGSFEPRAAHIILTFIQTVILQLVGIRLRRILF